MTETAAVVVLIAAVLGINALARLLQDIANQLRDIRETLEELTK